MKICFLTNVVHPSKGGSTLYFFNISQELQKQGHEVTVVCTQGLSVAPLAVAKTLYVTKIRAWRFSSLLQTFLFGLQAFMKIRRQEFDIYCYESGYLGFWVWLFRLAQKRPLIAFSMRYGWRMLRLNFRGRFKNLKLFYLAWEVLFAVQEVIDVIFSDKIVVFSPAAKQIWETYKIKPKRIELANFGINLDIFYSTPKNEQLLASLGWKPTDKIVLYIGHLEALRQVDVLLASFAELRKNIDLSLKLLIVGSGEQAANLKGIADNLDLGGSIKFIPHTDDQHELAKYYNLGDIFVSPEVPGTVVLLAAACGLPVIADTHTRGHLNAVNEAVLRTFIDIGGLNPQSISKTCIRLLSDPELLSKISQSEIAATQACSWARAAAGLAVALNWHQKTI